MTQATLPPDQTPEGWGNVAIAYDAHIRPSTTRLAAAALDATALREGERVLDVAAGTGALSIEAARRGAQVVATDFAPGMVAQLETASGEHGLQIDARVMDGQALDLPDAVFDAAYSILGVMFFPSPDAGLAEMHRVLKPGGRAGIVVWNVPDRSETFSTLFAALHDVVPDMPRPATPPPAFSLADPQDLARRMQEADFSDVHVRQVTTEFVDPSPEAAWEAFQTTNPVFPQILAQLDVAQADRLRTAFIRRAHSFVQDGALRMKAEAHLATGRA